MIITLTDGSQRVEDPITVVELAKKISNSLAKKIVGAKVNGVLVDTSFTITQDAQLMLIQASDPEGLDIIRHSCAHLLAQAVQAVYPEAQVTIGPVIENGFFYDFAFHRTFSPEDLILFEKKMQALVKANLPVTRTVMSRSEAIELFEKKGEYYKVEILRSIPDDQALSFYQQGDFIDLCRGPHVPQTSHIKAFKLQKVAGAYWRGDATNAMLQRIYGTAWATPEALAEYLHRLEEAEKRDHRKLGKKHDLFHLQEEAPGMIFWHPKGWTIYVLMQNYIRQKIRHRGYQEVNTPQLVDKSLWEKSGHWQMFANDMFSLQTEDRHYAVKPMNCPCHVQIYNQGLKSYRDLPLRLAEFGSCHRNEPSGALHGLLRCRAFAQDDAHIFCTDDQIQSEVSDFIDLLYEVYQEFGFHKISVKLSNRPDKRVGSDAEWDKAEQALEAALTNKGLDWVLCEGEGAFYGPKIEFSLHDSINRVWQCGTIQVDYSMPARLGAQYIAQNGERKIPVMLHRAILGSLERFIGIFIEECAGAFPFFWAPTQFVILIISESQRDYATKIEKKSHELGLRAQSDLRNEKIGFKIREHTMDKVPYLAVVGAKEVETNTISVRTREGVDLGAFSLEDFFEKMLTENQIINHKETK